MPRRPAALLRAALIAFGAVAAQPALAIDPPYQAEMERLAEIMGSLYFLQPLCVGRGVDWRSEVSELIELDVPDDDRRQRLFGAFNTGYSAYSRLYRSCTPPAETALVRLLVEAEKTARDLHSRYAE